MSAGTIVHGPTDGRNCADCGAVMELEALGKRHAWLCKNCWSGKPAEDCEVRELRRYASTWDRTVRALRKRFPG